MLFPTTIVVFKEGWNIRYKIKQYKDEWIGFIEVFREIIEDIR